MKTRTTDAYLQVAEGFLYAARDQMDTAETTLDRSVAIASAYALVSIARSLDAMVNTTPSDQAGNESGDMAPE